MWHQRLVCLVILPTLVACDAAARSPAPRYETATVERGDIRDIVPAVGQINPASQVDVGAEISGRVVAIHADFGSPVTQGQLLARLDASPYEALLTQAQAALFTARARQNVAVIELSVARRELARGESLASGGILPQTLLEEREAAVDVAEARLAEAEASVDLAQSRVAQAEFDLTRTEIRSPIDGFVQDRLVETGQAVSAAQSAPTLFRVSADLSNVIIEALVAENDIGRISEGMDARFTVDAYPNEVFQGVAGPVRRSPHAQGRFVSYPVHIRAQDPQQRLLPGMTASVEFIRAEARLALRVPVESLYVIPTQWFPQGITDDDIRAIGLEPDYANERMRRAAYIGLIAGRMIREGKRRIFVLRDGVPTMLAVRLGAEDEHYVEVVEGDLAIGDEVITREVTPS
tara:strand:- start:441 stop:1655 length:1215 start_codon:yes stop_codon:yes gene_type:complete